jgi:hypothetical protein
MLVWKVEQSDNLTIEDKSVFLEPPDPLKIVSS